MSTWEERMAGRAARRTAAARAEEERREEAGRARLEAAFPALAGESGVIEEGPHKGHRTHASPWHGNGVCCSCGVITGCFTIGIAGDEPEAGPCPVCVARGIPLDVR